MSGNYHPSTWDDWGKRGDAAYFTNPVDFVSHLHGDHLDWLPSRLSVLLAGVRRGQASASSSTEPGQVVGELGSPGRHVVSPHVQLAAQTLALQEVGELPGGGQRAGAVLHPALADHGEAVLRRLVRRGLVVEPVAADRGAGTPAPPRLPPVRSAGFVSAAAGAFGWLRLGCCWCVGLASLRVLLVRSALTRRCRLSTGAAVRGPVLSVVSGSVEIRGSPGRVVHSTPCCPQDRLRGPVLSVVAGSVVIGGRRPAAARWGWRSATQQRAPVAPFGCGRAGATGVIGGPDRMLWPRQPGHKV
jgi:hypothetical protein